MGSIVISLRLRPMFWWTAIFVPSVKWNIYRTDREEIKMSSLYLRNYANVITIVPQAGKYLLSIENVRDELWIMIDSLLLFAKWSHFCHSVFGFQASLHLDNKGRRSTAIVWKKDKSNSNWTAIASNRFVLRIKIRIDVLHSMRMNLTCLPILTPSSSLNYWCDFRGIRHNPITHRLGHHNVND